MGLVAELLTSTAGARIGGASGWSIAGGVTAAALSYTWTVGAHSNGTAPAGSGYTVRGQSLLNPAKSDRSDAPKPAGRSPEQVCTGWFSAARNYARNGMTDDARRCLNNIVSGYPGTDWAAKAAAELARL